MGGRRSPLLHADFVLLVTAAAVALALACVNDALGQGAVILLITAAGGAFGAVLRETAIGQSIGSLDTANQVLALPIVFLVTALIRTAQGSATVAMTSPKYQWASSSPPGLMVSGHQAMVGTRMPPSVRSRFFPRSFPLLLK